MSGWQPTLTILPPHPCQDDEVPPSGCGWLRNLLAMFGGHPKLGAIGLKIGQFNTRGDNNVKDRRQVYFRVRTTPATQPYVLPLMHPCTAVSTSQGNIYPKHMTCAPLPCAQFC